MKGPTRSPVKIRAENAAAKKLAQAAQRKKLNAKPKVYSKGKR